MKAVGLAFITFFIYIFILKNLDASLSHCKSYIISSLYFLFRTWTRHIQNEAGLDIFLVATMFILYIIYIILFLFCSLFLLLYFLHGDRVISIFQLLDFEKANTLFFHFGNILMVLENRITKKLDSYQMSKPITETHQTNI